MILYHGAAFHPRLLVQIKGSVFPFSCLVALPAALLSILLKLIVSTLADDSGFDALGLSDPDTVLGVAWSSVSSLLGFLVVFRTSQAYARFWEGTSAMYQMLGEWFDATSSLVAFCKRSKADKKDILVFQHTLVRLVSLLNAVVLTHLSSGGEAHGYDPHAEVDFAQKPTMRAFELELIDAEGIDRQSLLTINQVEDKVELIFQWIQQLIVETDTRKIFSVAPPILSRAFQELAQGMVRYHDASKIASVPLPFPYMQTMEVLLVFHWIVTPFLTSMWVQSALWTPILTFIQIFFFWSLNCIACELENPFGEDVNDLPAQEMQMTMNRKLLLLLRPGTERTARLSPQAAFDEVEEPGRPHIIRLGTKVGFGKDGISMNTKADRILNRRISLGSLQESIQDESGVELEVYVTEADDGKQPYDSESSAFVRSPTRKSTDKNYKVREVSKSSASLDTKYFDWVQPRDFEEKALASADSLGQRLGQVVAVCEDIRDRMRKLECEQFRDVMSVLSQGPAINGGSHSEAHEPASGRRLPPGPFAPPQVPLAARSPGGKIEPPPLQSRDKELICCGPSASKPKEKIHRNSFTKPP